MHGNANENNNNTHRHTHTHAHKDLVLECVTRIECKESERETTEVNDQLNVCARVYALPYVKHMRLLEEITYGFSVIYAQRQWKRRCSHMCDSVVDLMS